MKRMSLIRISPLVRTCKKKKQREYNNKNSTHSHAFHASPTASHIRLESILMTINTHPRRSNGWRKSVGREKGERDRGQGTRRREAD